MEEIKRNDPKRQQNSVLPTSPIYPDTLNRYPTTGIKSLTEVIKLLNKRKSSRIVENATVLELWPPAGELKTKYKLPHLNMKDDKYFEDFLLKIRDPIHDEGSKVNPEDYLIELQKLDNDQKPSSFFDGKKYTPEQSIALKQYYECVATHSTFAPRASSGLFSSPPAPGTKVRIHYFQEPYISAGHTIAGLYEKMYDDNIFEEGKKEIRDLLKKYRQKYLQAVATAKNIPQIISQNIPQSNQPTTTSNAQATQGEYGNVSDPLWPPRDVVSAYIGTPESTSRALYDQIIDQFQVATNPRYNSRDAIPGNGKIETFCNVFVADVTWAMGLPVPWQQDENGVPVPMSAQFKRGWTQNGPSGMITWLTSHGLRYEWKEVNSREAQDNANLGITTIVITEHHVGMVRPGEGRKVGNSFYPSTAQAGWPPGENKNNTPANNGFSGNIRYFSCLRKQRYTTPTQQQLDSLNKQQSSVPTNVNQPPSA